MPNAATLACTQTYVGGNRFNLSFQVLTADGAPVREARIVVSDSYGEEAEILTDEQGFALRTFGVDDRRPQRVLKFFVPGSAIKPRQIVLYSQSS